MMKTLMSLLMLVSSLSLISCSSSSRSPASYNRAGRTYKAPRVMNRRALDSDSLYKNCLKERADYYCRSRLGR